MSSGSSSFGWKVAWASFTIAMFSWGIGFYGPSVFLQTLHALHGWAISVISAAITAHFLFSAVLITHLPEVHQRFGIARVTQAGVGDVGRVVALITAINQAVFAFAPAVLGALRDLEAGYTLSFGIAASVQVVASLIVISYRIR